MYESNYCLFILFYTLYSQLGELRDFIPIQGSRPRSTKKGDIGNCLLIVSSSILIIFLVILTQCLSTSPFILFYGTRPMAFSLSIQKRHNSPIFGPHITVTVNIIECKVLECIVKEGIKRGE